MPQTATVHIGVDVSKHHLDLSTFDRKPRRICNDRTAIRGLVRRVKALGGETIVTCEATGGYEALLILELSAAGIPVSRVNPLQVKAFIRSQGVSAKTDPIDAEMIARFAEVREQGGRLFIVDASEAPRADLRALLTRRAQLKEMILQEANRLDPVPARAVAADIRGLLRQLKTRLRRVEAALLAWLEENAEFRELHRRMDEVKGLGLLSILALIAFVPELGKVSDRRAAALLGLAPYNRDSGASSRRMHIHGGRTYPRRILYMAALSAARSNPILKAFYKKLRGEGKPAKVALIAVARKLVVLANKIAANPQFKVS